MPSPIEKVGPAQGSLDEILMHIPGFQGYVKMELRRDADKTQRDYLAHRLQTARKAVEAVKTALARKVAMTHLGALESLTDKLYRVASRIENADRGYSGFFDAHKVGEDELRLLYEADLALVQEVQAVEKAAGALKPDLEDTGMNEAIQELDRRIDELDQRFDRRKQVIQGVV